MDPYSTIPKFRLDSDLTLLAGWRKLFTACPQKKYPKKTVIVEQGHNAKLLYYVVSGLVEYTYVQEDGEENLIEILGSGTLFPLQPIFGRNAAVGSFVALEDCVLAAMPIDDATRHLQDSTLAGEIIVDFAHISGGLIRQLAIYAERPNIRVEELLCAVGEYKLRGSAGQKEVFLALSQLDLARMTHTTRVTVTKILSDLKKMQLVDTVYGGIIIKDLAGLKRSLEARPK